MNKIPNVVFLLTLLLIHPALASTIVWDVISAAASDIKYDEEGAEYYQMSFGCMITGQDFQANMAVLSTFVFSGRNVVVSPWTMDVGTGKYISHVQQGDIIDANSVRDEDRLFDNNWGVGYGWDYETDTEYDNRHDIVVPRNGTFMLGFEIENYLVYDPVTLECDHTYGWAIFQFDGTSVSVTSSALVVGADGIYAGTGIVIPRQIPEPGVAMLLCVGAVVFLLRRGNLIFALSHNSTIS